MMRKKNIFRKKYERTDYFITQDYLIGI